MPASPESRKRRLPAPVLAIVGLALFLVAVAIVAATAGASPDLTVASSDIVPEVTEPTKGTQVDVDVSFTNEGDANATGFYVKLKDVTAAVDIGNKGPFSLVPSASGKVTFTWDLTGASGGKHTLRAVLDPTGVVSEDDETDNSADKDVTVNLPPTAKATSSQEFAYTNTAITFTASGSSDSDGTLQKYLWYYGDGKVGQGMNVSHTYADGSPPDGKYYNITLVVTDNDGGVGSATITVRIYNRLPYAVAKDAIVNTMTPVSISGDSSYDTDGKVVRFRWTLHNDTVMWGSPLVVTYPDDGRYRVSLTVWDDDGETDTTAIYVTVLNQAPKVNLVVNRSMVVAGESIGLDASGSYDVDGSIASYTWIFGDTTTGSGKVVSHAYSSNGSYNITLVVVDDDGALAYKTARVIVGNSAPVAVARASSGYVLTLETVDFNASSSSDPDGNLASYAWDFGDGDSSTGVATSHSYEDDGTYTVTLTVTDTGGAYGITSITVVVGNRAPHVEFTDLTVVTGEAVLLDGSYCYDLDGYIASYLWDLGDGLVYSTANATHVWENPGAHLATLKIWDDDGATNETTFNVTVLNRSPVAHMVASPMQTTLAKPVRFNGTGSYDPDGEIVNWTWNFGDGQRAFGPQVSHTYAVYGTYLATLSVRDDTGGINSTSVLITVRNQPPLAIINVTATSIYTGDTVTFDGTESSDPENQIANFYWSFGDGGSATGAVVTHAYTDDGRFTVKLTVVDQDSTSSFVELVVKVLNRAPLAKAEANPTSVKTHEAVSFVGTGSSDPDGKVLWYQWRFGDGSSAFGATVTHSFADDGTYTVTLIATDDDGDEGIGTVEVTVANRAPVSVAGEDMATQTGVPLRLDGRGSYDTDGTISLYHWDFGDGSTANGPVVTHAFPAHGDFQVELTVTDDDGSSTTSNLTVTVSNVQPVARIQGDTRVLSGEELELDSTTSYDLDGDIVDRRWDMGDGSVEKVGPIVEYAYGKVGTYTVTLTVEDDGGLTSSVSVKVEVLNRRPTAVLSASKTHLVSGETVQLDGTGSSDPDGRVETYTWILGDGSVAYGSRLSHVYTDNGIYMVVLTVTDDMGGTDSRSLFIQVDNRPPMPAIFGAEEVDTLVLAEFTAEGTLDPDGKVVGYFWDFGDGAGSNGWNVTHIYTTSGVFTVRLTAMDDDGRSASTNVTVLVINRPPVAEADVAATAVENSTVRYDATGSYDADGILSTWEWDFGDGKKGEGREAYHRYSDSGTFTWTLTVTDDTGASTEVNGSIIVTERPDEPVNPGKPGGNDEDDGFLNMPGPGALVALATLVAVGALMSTRRSGRRE